MSVPYPPQLLDEYTGIIRRRPKNALADTALRTRSLTARHLLAYAATKGGLTLAELITAARGDDALIQRLGSTGMQARALADLAKVVALQDILPEDKSDGLALYNMVLKLFGPSQMPPEHQGVHAQLAYDLGHPSEALALLRTYRAVPEQVRADLLMDLANPFTGSAVLRTSGWHGAFRRLFPKPHPAIKPDEQLPVFDRLGAVPDRKAASPDLVSVVVTAFKPGAGLITAVRSLIDQSWENLEILVIDDGSPPEFDTILDHCRELDQRVKVIKLAVNGGTYRARNVGIETASGRFVTFQDSDDWSHPRRLEMQIQPLLHDPAVMATTSDGLRVSEDLLLTKPGRNPRVMNTSSLLLRKKAVVSRIGYFDEVRKAADSEYLKRIEAAFGPGAVRRLHGQILALIRLSPGSLSRAEIRAGWMDPARMAYRSAYESWHERVREGRASAYLPRRPPQRPFSAPRKLTAEAGNPASRRLRYDIIFINDWRWLRESQRSMLDEIRLLTGQGMRIAVMHLESFRHMTPYRKPLGKPVQELINDGLVDQVLPADEAEAALLIVGDPSVLEFPPAEPSNVRAARAIVAVDRAPRARDGGEYRYAPELCAESVRRFFGTDLQWCPRGFGVRELLAAELPPSRLTWFDLPRALDVSRYPRRSRFRSNRPVIGRAARDHRSTWPADREALLQVYPDTDDVDVRILGGADSTLSLLGTPAPPETWLLYAEDEISLRSFMFQVDFYVYFPGTKLPDESWNAVLDALASGCVVILPHHFSEVFREAAVYCHADQVQETIWRYYRDRTLFVEQSRRGQDWAQRHCDPRSYLRIIAELVGSPGDGELADSESGDTVVSYANRGPW